MRGGPTEVRYFVLPDIADPCILARVRWPDVFEAISPSRADWQQDPGLFDLPYDRPHAQVPPETAGAIAREWGATLGPEEAASTSLMRRMPANWSDLSRAEQRAWSVEFHGGRRRGPQRERAPAPMDAELVVEEVIDLTEPPGDTILPAKGV
jgi:hypothetical protein